MLKIILYFLSTSPPRISPSARSFTPRLAIPGMPSSALLLQCRVYRRHSAPPAQSHLPCGDSNQPADPSSPLRKTPLSERQGIILFRFPLLADSTPLHPLRKSAQGTSSSASVSLCLTKLHGITLWKLVPARAVRVYVDLTVPSLRISSANAVERIAYRAGRAKGGMRRMTSKPALDIVSWEFARATYPPRWATTSIWQG